MAEKMILGIDIGTTSVKAGLIDQAGQVHASFAQSYPTQRPAPGHAQQDPRDWLRLIDAAIERVVAAGYGPAISAVGLCSQVNTHVFLDASGTPLLPAILWQDGRATQQARALDTAVTDAQKCAWWGAPMPIDASNVLSRMAWVAQTHPDIWDQTRWVMLPKDYCLLELTGRAVTDPLSNIGLVGADLAYVPDVFDLVPGSSDKVAPLAPITQTIGHIRADRPLAGVPVVAGTMDAWAGIIGAGGAQQGASVYLSGTSEILGLTSATVTPTPGAIVFPQTEGLRIHAAPTQSGGDAKLWFTQVTGLTPQAMADLVGQTPRSPATPLFLPQLEGERAPLWNAELRAAFHGISRQTGLGDFARAVYEGVALSALHALQTIQSSAGTDSPTIGCGGGGFRSDAWAQIRADVLGAECHILNLQDPGLLGAAMIAGVGTGQFATLGDAHAALVRFGKVISPDASAHDRYRELFAIYKDAIASNAAISDRLREIC